MSLDVLDLTAFALDLSLFILFKSSKESLAIGAYLPASSLSTSYSSSDSLFMLSNPSSLEEMLELLLESLDELERVDKFPV